MTTSSVTAANISYATLQDTSCTKVIHSGVKTEMTKRANNLGSSRASVSLSTIQTAESLWKNRRHTKIKSLTNRCCIAEVLVKSYARGLYLLCVPWCRAVQGFLGNHELPERKIKYGEIMFTHFFRFKQINKYKIENIYVYLCWVIYLWARRSTLTSTSRFSRLTLS